jgi:hypothetical protein
MKKNNENSDEEIIDKKKFRIPLALDMSNTLVLPSDAEKGNKYCCPACHEPIILRKGNVYAAHFSHHISSICTSETILHLTAKMLIQKAVRDWNSGNNDAPFIIRKCIICESDIITKLHKMITDAELEYRIENGLVADVALMSKSELKAIVEIRVTHAVDENKVSNITVPFIELDGETVIKEPNLWKTIAHNSPRNICNNCEDKYKKFMLKVKCMAERNKIILPTDFYRYSICSCYRCKRQIIVYAWPKNDIVNFDDDNVETQSSPMPEPIPCTIQYRYSKFFDSYDWVNTCPYCNCTQSDYHLFLDHTFNCMRFNNDFNEDFVLDIKKNAYGVYEKGLLNTI